MSDETRNSSKLDTYEYTHERDEHYSYTGDEKETGEKRVLWNCDGLNLNGALCLDMPTHSNTIYYVYK